MDDLDKEKEIDIKIEDGNKEINNIDEKENMIDENVQNNINNINQNNQEKIISNSHTKSFESEKNDKQENINNNEEINNNILEKKENENIEEEKKNEENKKIEEENKKIEEENKINEENNNKNEEKILDNIEEKKEDKKEEKLEDKIEEKKDEKENKKNEKNRKEKYIGEKIVREPNKEPNLGPIAKSQLKPSINKIKNKTIDQTIKTLLNTDEEKNNQIIEPKDKNKFMNKLKEFKREISKKEDMNRYIQTKNIFEFTFKKYEGNNRYKNSNGDLAEFNFNVNEPLKNDQLKLLKEKYFKSNQFLYTPSKKDFTYKRNNIFLDKDTCITSYKHSCKNRYNKNYYLQSCNNKPLVYKKNSLNFQNKKNFDFIRLINSMDNLDLILKKYKKTIDYDFPKNINENNKYNYLLFITINKNKYKNFYNYKTKINTLSSSNFENSKKLQNLMNDVYHEIKQRNKNPSKNYEFKSKLSTIKSRISSYSANKYNNNLLRNDFKYNNYSPDRLKMHKYTPQKSNNLNFNELLDLCSKENLRTYYINSRKD